MARNKQLPSTGQKSTIINKLYHHRLQAVCMAGHSPDPPSICSSTAFRHSALTPHCSYRAPTPHKAASPLPLFASEPPAMCQTIGNSQRSSQDPNLSPMNARAEASTASLKRTVQLMIDQSLKGLEDRLLRSFHPLPPVDVGNISLPSPCDPSLPPLQPDITIENSTNVNNNFTKPTEAPTTLQLHRSTPLPPYRLSRRWRGRVSCKVSTLNLIPCYVKHCSRRSNC